MDGPLISIIVGIVAMILIIIKIRIPVALVNVNKAEVGGVLGDNGAIIAFGALVNMVWIKAKYPATQSPAIA